MNLTQNSTQTLACLIATALLFIGCTKDETPVGTIQDYHPPEIEWLAPQSGAELSGIVELTFSMSDDESGIDRINVYRNGFSPDTWQLTASEDSVYSISWNTENVDDDVYILEVRAYDEAGNLGISPSLMVRVKNNPDPPPEDLIPPVVAWVDPLSDAVVSDTVELCFQVMDNVGVDSNRVYLNGFSPLEFYLPGHEEIDYQILWDTREVEDDDYILEVRAWDIAGNMGISPLLVISVLNSPPRPEDRTPPDIWWTSPEAGSTLRDTVTLQLRFFDETGVDSIRLIKNGAPVETIRTDGREGIYEYRWITYSDDDGVYIWEARAWDAAGNSEVSPALLVKVQNNQEPPPDDQTPPVIAWLSPISGQEVEGIIEVQFQAMDFSGVDSVRLHISGSGSVEFFFEGHQEVNYAVNWNTETGDDGVYILQVNAWDSYGNVGISSLLSVIVANNRPRVIWVPDDFETIQNAIWNSENGDTIMVRAGEYREQIQFFYKNLSLISESGPEETIIDGTDLWAIVWLGGGQDSTMLIRGFTFINPSEFQCYCLNIDGVGTKIVNNIFSTPNTEVGYGILGGHITSQIHNNLFININCSGDFASSWGDIDNNMVINAAKFLYNAQRHGQPLIPDYNLLWNVERLTTGSPMGWGEHNIVNQEPLFEEDSYRLREGSPGIDQGRPDLLDPDGSRSDIGVYGGPYAYPIP